MSVRIVFETHAWSTDNEEGVASGWNRGGLSDRGRVWARELGKRRRDEPLAAVFSSDLLRAVETAAIAFSNARIPIYFDSRLRECNYGDWNGAPIGKLTGRRRQFLSSPYPNGQSYEDVVTAMAALADMAQDWNGRRVLLIGHSATRWALDVLLGHRRLEDLVDAPFDWQPGWEYATSSLPGR